MRCAETGKSIFCCRCKNCKNRRMRNVFGNIQPKEEHSISDDYFHDKSVDIERSRIGKSRKWNEK